MAIILDFLSEDTGSTPVCDTIFYTVHGAAWVAVRLSPGKSDGFDSRMHGYKSGWLSGLGEGLQHLSHPFESDTGLY